MIDTIIEILIDASGSMGYCKGYPTHEGKYLIDGQTRMTLIKRILIEEIIPTIEYASKIIVRTFRADPIPITFRTDPILIFDYKIYTPVIYEGSFDRPKLTELISNLSDPPAGGTPIAYAINKAVVDLQNFSNQDRKIILLTDGEENAGGDYRDAAKKALTLEGIPCKIFIVGIAQNEEAEKKSIEIATGFYLNLKSTKYSADALKKALVPFKTEVLRESLSTIKVVTDSQPTITTQKQAIVEKKLEALKQESNQAVTMQLEDLERKIQEQILNSQKLLSEITSLKELVRVNTLLELDIDSTTLTIDNEYSESICRRSETFLYSFLCQKHGVLKVKWLNNKEESYLNHDFELLDDNGKTIQLVECKGTTKDKPTFYLTVDEWNYFLANREIYQLYRVFNVDSEMRPVCIENLFSSILNRQVVPYLIKPEILKEGRVFLTLMA